MIKRMMVVAILVIAGVSNAASSATTGIEQVGQKFSQSSLSIAKGDTVVFHNQDDVTHNINVIDESGSPEDQGLQKPGEDITKKFDDSGTFEIRCAIHPRMKMTIKVK